MAQSDDQEDTEYQFNEAEDIVYDDHAEEASSASKKEGSSEPVMPSSRLKKIIIIIIAVILIIFLGYKLIGLFTGQKSAAKNQLTPINIIDTPSKSIQAMPMEPVAPDVQKSVIDGASLTEAPDISMATAKKDEQPASKPLMEMTSQQTKPVEKAPDTQAALEGKTLARIEHQVMEGQTRLSSLEGQLSDLSTNVSSLQNSISELSGTIQNNQALQKEVDAYRLQTQAVKENQIRHVKRYYVQAVIPGRAWLQGADGTTITVGTGDNLSGYGKIQSIDPYSGMVKTSSGIDINYGITE